MNASVSPSLSKVSLGLSTVVVMVILALGTFFVSAWGESDSREDRTVLPPAVHYLSEKPLSQDMPLTAGMNFSTNGSGELDFLFEGADVLRLLPDSELVFEAVDLSVRPFLLRARLVSGTVWMSNLQDTVDLEVRTDRVAISPHNASTFVHLEEGTVTVFSAHHPTRVSFLEANDSSVVLNDYLLTESHRVTIPEASLNESLKELRYTKLTKEYPFVFVDLEDWEKEWVVNLKADLDRQDEAFRLFLAELRRTGSEGVSKDSVFYGLEQGYKRLRGWLTFDKAYLAQVEMSDDLDVLYQALYLILDDRDAEALDRLNRFQALVSTFDSTDSIDRLVRVFRAVKWGNEFYPVKNLLRAIQLNVASSEDRHWLSLQFLRDRLNEVYDVLDLGEHADSKAALSDYNQEWLAFMGSSSKASLEGLVQRLTEERQILQNLLFREDAFYSLDSYTVLSSLEQRILNLTAQDFDLNEERLAFVQDKIRVLTHLVNLIDTQVVNVKDGVMLADHLLRESDRLMDSVSQDVAVTSYFSERLEDLTRRFEFIRSPEFSLGIWLFDHHFSGFLSPQIAL